MNKFIISAFFLFTTSTVLAKEIIFYRKSTLSVYTGDKKKIGDSISYSKSIANVEKAVFITETYSQSNSNKPNELDFAKSKISKNKNVWIQEFKDFDGKIKTTPVKNIQFAKGIISSATVERNLPGQGKSVLKFTEDDKKSSVVMTNYGINGKPEMIVEGNGNVISEAEFKKAVARFQIRK